MNEMITWLRAQLDTDEAHARKDIWAAERATPGRWTARYGHNLPASWIETESGPVAKFDSGRHDADALLVARFRPDNVRARAERVLRQVQAHRAILNLCERRDDAAAEYTVRQLGSIYSERAGFRPPSGRRRSGIVVRQCENPDWTPATPGSAPGHGRLKRSRRDEVYAL